MNRIIFSTLFLCFAFFYVNGQSTESASKPTSSLSLANIEFTLYPNPTDQAFKLEFLLPKKEQLEMYLIDAVGDPIKQLLPTQEVEAGVRAYDFEFPSDVPHGIYFLVIKSSSRTLIKKIEHRAGA